MKDLTQVDGVKVVERQQARYSEGDAPSPQSLGREIATVHELLLENGNVVYQCMHPMAEGCTHVADRAIKVTAHQAAHSAAYQLRQTKRELEKTKQELQQRKERQREGGIKAAKTRESRRLAVPTEAAPRKPKGELTDLEAAARRVVVAFNAMQDATNEFQNVFLGYMRLAASAETTAAPDPEIVAKAEKWDKYLEFQAFVSAPTLNASGVPAWRRSGRTGNGL